MTISMLASGSLLAQVRPSVTTAVSAFTASLVTEITNIVVCNTTGSAVDFSLFHDDDGSTFDQTTALHYQKSIGANDTLYLRAESVGAGFTLNASAQLGVQTGTANALTISVYGVTEKIAHDM